MHTYFVSRHPGAIAWAKSSQNNLKIDKFIGHIDPTTIEASDVVIGSLPVHLAAQVCACGAKYIHLSIDMPFELRGKELSAEQLHLLNAKLVSYRIQAVL